MLQLILCDDDRFILKLSQEKLEELNERYQLGIRIDCCTTNSQEMLRYLSENPGNYLIFLDLDFGEGKLNGIDVARKAKQLSKESKVVFLTNHQEMAMQVLSSGVEPFGFLEKTTDFQQLSQGFLRYSKMAAQTFAQSAKQQNPVKDKQIQLIVGIDEKIILEESQILYLEAEKSVSHGITYHTLDGSGITVRDTMEHCQEKLGQGFLRIHRSLLVNRRYVVGMKGSQVRLSNGEMLPCSVRMQKEVKRCLL